jgi:hypothetical protein
VDKNSWGCATRALGRMRCLLGAAVSCSRATVNAVRVFDAAAGALPYAADGMSCTCDSFASAGSSLVSLSATIGAFSDGGTCVGARAEAQSCR